jgi:hypothetical protein
MGSRALNITAAALAVLLLGSLSWLLLTPAGRSSGLLGRQPKLQRGSNPNLDVRFEYDAAQLSMGPFVDNAEFPFLLEGDAWLMQGKRIRGMASLLHKEPISALYDWLGTMQMEGLEQYYDLKEGAEPVYEDWQVQERLAVHQSLVYEVTADKPRLPLYFPQSVRDGAAAGSKVYVNGWIFFTEKDLFFFQTVSAQPLTEAQQQASDGVLQSMQFDALLGGVEKPNFANPPESGETEDPAAAPDAPDGTAAPDVPATP